MTNKERKNLMKKAHEVAKKINSKVGNYQIALSLALKDLWKIKKTYHKKVLNVYTVESAVKFLTGKSTPKNTFGVPQWFINKNLPLEEQAALAEAYGAFTKRETAKAELINFDTPYGYINVWVPKSILVK